jgi:hypothetical protein
VNHTLSTMQFAAPPPELSLEDGEELIDVEWVTPEKPRCECNLPKCRCSSVWNRGVSYPMKYAPPQWYAFQYAFRDVETPAQRAAWSGIPEYWIRRMDEGRVFNAWSVRPKGPFPCTQCTQSFDTGDELLWHSKTKLQEERMRVTMEKKGLSFVREQGFAGYRVDFVLRNEAHRITVLLEVDEQGHRRVPYEEECERMERITERVRAWRPEEQITWVRMNPDGAGYTLSEKLEGAAEVVRVLLEEQSEKRESWVRILWLFYGDEIVCKNI